ncbi:MAG: DMT family transporter [Oscillospiraceae bacterium]|nr:DMT family transporter [Oscillospiraceae bacterium]
MITQNNKGPLCMVAAAICWSLGGLLFQFIPWNATSIIGLRALFAAIVFAIFRKSIKVKLTPGNIMAALFLSATTMLFVFSNQLTTAAAAVMLQFTAPVFILLIQFLFYKKKPKPSELVAVVITILGMLLFFADDIDAGHMLGNILAIISGLTFACVFVCNQRPDTEPEQSVMLGFLINAILWTPFAFFDSNITAEFVPWIFIIVMGVVQVGFAYVFFTIGIKHTPALLASLIVALEPVLNPIWVALFTPERPGRYAIFGGAVIVITIVTYNVWVAKRERIKS